MPTFKGKDGKPVFAMNPQAGKAKYGDPVQGQPPEMPGFAGAAGDEADDGHDHNGVPKATHVEIHPGANPQGQPPMDNASHHTVAHSGDGMTQDIRNHGSFDEAANQAKDSLHVECPECGAEVPVTEETVEKPDGGGDEGNED